MQLDPNSLEKYGQVISSEMKLALKESAEKRGISLDMEIALRLAALMTEPELNEDNKLSNKFIRNTFTYQELVEECKRKRKDNLFLFEIEKLRHYLHCKHQLPRDYKEHFMLINAKEWTKIIQAELNIEKKHNKGKSGDA